MLPNNNSEDSNISSCGNTTVTPNNEIKKNSNLSEKTSILESLEVNTFKKDLDGSANFCKTPPKLIPISKASLTNMKLI